MNAAASALPASLAVAALACLAAANPARRAAALLGATRPSWRSTATAAVVTALVLGTLAAAAGGLLDALDIDTPTARLAAGLVLVVVALAQLVGGAPAALPGTTDRYAALVPLAFPLLLRPELALVGLSAGADHGVVAVLLVAVPLLLTAVVSAVAPADDRLLEPTGRLLAAVGVLAGVDLVVDGVIAL